MPGFLYIVAGDRRPGRCKFCRKPIEFVTRLASDSRRGHNKAKLIPINPNALTLRYERTAGGIKVEVLDAGAIHFATCAKKPPRPPRMFGGRA